MRWFLKTAAGGIYRLEPANDAPAGSKAPRFTRHGGSVNVRRHPPMAGSRPSRVRWNRMVGFR